MLKISRESEINLINVLIDNDVISGKDLINIKKTSKRYGRMLEIKCPTTREITGIPKKEYWIQTQLQMECCDLEECDFLECSFKEYENEEEANKDGTFQYTSENKFKGVIMQFYHNTKPYYEYAPFNISKELYDKWYEETMEKNHDKTANSNLILLERGEKLKVKADKKSEFLFIAGKPIGEPIARGGPFVMNTKAEILEAIQDYNNGTFAKY